jgi:hypothetical protein
VRPRVRAARQGRRGFSEEGVVESFSEGVVEGEGEVVNGLLGLKLSLRAGMGMGLVFGVGVGAVVVVVVDDDESCCCCCGFESRGKAGLGGVSVSMDARTAKGLGMGGF